MIYLMRYWYSYAEKDKIALPDKRAKMDNKECSQGSRHKIVHGEVYPVPVPAEGPYFPAQEVREWVQNAEIQ